MKKRILACLLCACLLTGCAFPGIKKQVYQITWLDVFDTVTTLRGYAPSEREFNETAAKLHEALLEYHRLFDVYTDYPELVNLKTVNDTASSAPVAAPEPILQLLQFCREAYSLTDGRVNAAMGAVLLLWHEAREAALADPEHAAVPDAGGLSAAAEHCDIENLILDMDAGTVYFADPLLRLDVGAVAKGWAAQQAVKLLPEGYLLNLGGNTCASGAKPDGSPWIIGIQSPDAEEEYLMTVPMASGSAVTSGDYQRFFMAEGIRYHHIIDPDTLMPGAYWRSVTVLCADSGLADCLSTALFLLPEAEGRALAARCGAQVLWVAADGTQIQTEGFPTK